MNVAVNTSQTQCVLILEQVDTILGVLTEFEWK